jgi:hypothetical protein
MTYPYSPDLEKAIIEKLLRLKQVSIDHKVINGHRAQTTTANVEKEFFKSIKGTKSPGHRRKSSVSPTNKIGVAFLVPGVIVLFTSIYTSSQILAFIGLGAMFWGALFLLIAPKRLFEGSYLYNAALPEYSTIDRITADLGLVAKAYHIPAYPGGIAFPEHLRGLKETVVFVSSLETFAMPSIEDISREKFLLENKGILVPPPGLGLLRQIEGKMKIIVSNISIDELCEILPGIILGELALAKEMEIIPEKERIHLALTGSVYENLYSSESSLRSSRFLGCPIVSAIAVLLAQVSGKIVTISGSKVSSDGLTIETDYQMVG